MNAWERLTDVRDREDVATYVALILLALAAETAARLDLSGSLRPTLAIGFLLVAPGLAVLRASGLARGLPAVALALPLSLALGITVSLATALAGAWSPDHVRGLLVVATVALAAAGLARTTRRPEAES